MPINVYTGLMRSGKSYEAVSQVVVPAVASGRRVVTNVDGISNDLVRAYVVEKKGVALDKLGEVVHVKNEDVFRDDFFPYYDDHHGEHTDTLVQPGDLVVIDEAWRFWGTDCKLHKHHKSFFLEHGHFTHAQTGVACDLVLMIQDMGTLHRFVKNVVAFTFRTHKKVSLGLGNTYSVQMWEGYKQTKAAEIGNWVRRYDAEVFPLYSSFKDGAQGKLVNVDKRQNIFSNPRLWAVMALAVFGGAYSFYNVYRFFRPAVQPAAEVTSDAKPAAVAGASSAIAPVRAAVSGFSDGWRYAGSVSAGVTNYVLVVGSDGRIRLESPSMFRGRGLAALGEIDGSRVTAFSGKVSGKGGEQ